MGVASAELHSRGKMFSHYIFLLNILWSTSLISASFYGIRAYRWILIIDPSFLSVSMLACDNFSLDLRDVTCLRVSALFSEVGVSVSAQSPLPPCPNLLWFLSAPQLRPRQSWPPTTATRRSPPSPRATRSPTSSEIWEDGTSKKYWLCSLHPHQVTTSVHIINISACPWVLYPILSLTPFILTRSKWKGMERIQDQTKILLNLDRPTKEKVCIRNEKYVLNIFDAFAN